LGEWVGELSDKDFEGPASKTEAEGSAPTVGGSDGPLKWASDHSKSVKWGR